MDEAADTTGIETQALLAGAWARGVADAFSMLGLPAIFVDSDGRVLHVGREALPHFGRALAIDRQRLVVAGADAHAALGDALAGAGPGRPGRARLDDSGLIAHVLAIPAAPGQILAAIVLLVDAADSAAESLAATVLARAQAPLPTAH